MGIAAIFIEIGILILSFQLWEFWCYFYEHWNSDLILLKAGILGLFFYTFAFWCYPSNHGNCGHIYRDWNSILFFQLWEFWCYFYKVWNSDLILQNIWIPVLFFCKRWNSDLILSNIGILALFSLVCLLQSGCAGPINYHVFLPWTLASLGIDRSI